MVVICTKCKICLPVMADFFGPDKRSPLGLQSQCRKCRNAYKLEDYYKRKDKFLIDRKIYRNKNKEKIIEHFRCFNKTTERSEYLKKHYLDNREHYRRKYSNWRSSNLGKRAADAAKRRASEGGAMPAWLTDDEKKEIKNIYVEARDLSWLSDGGLVVDHIIPLNGKTVSGLHVPWNLRIIPYKENASKGNKLVMGTL